MHRRLVVMLVLALIPVAVVPTPATAAETGTFVIRCDPGHTAQVDPIVNPGPIGTVSAHTHQFFGALDTASDSTLTSMREDGTTCRHSGDTAGYWVPRLMDAQGEPVPVTFSFAYYKLEPDDRAFPPDLRMIAGGVGNESRTFWDCFSAGGRYSAPPRCAADDHVVVRVSFPDCWDGVRLDSPDHRSHMAYPRKGSCPVTHPVKLPRINLFVRWCLGACAVGGRFSDGTTTLHADFWNTWDQAALEALVARCASRNCGQVTA